MPDWTLIVREHLGRLDLVRAREAEIVAEIAAHLEDACAEAVCAGADGDHAVQHALALVPDWALLSRELSKEADMSERLRTLWVPGMTMAVLAMGALYLLARVGLQPRILWLGGHAVTFYVPWLLLLPIVGAIAALWSRHAGGHRSDLALAAAAPSLATAAFFLFMLPISFVVERDVALGLKLGAFAAFFLGWVIVPGAGLLIGALPFLARRHAPDAARS